MFQSLFSWKMVWDVNAILGLRPILSEFQSLFSWKMVWDLLTYASEEGKLTCFNPCFLGRWFETPRRYLPRRYLPRVSILVFLEDGLRPISFIYTLSLNLFQSLFSWKMVWDIFVIEKTLWKYTVSILVFLEDGLRQAGI